MRALAVHQRPALEGSLQHPGIDSAPMGTLVREFCRRLCANDRLGPIFAGVIGGEREPHVEKMTDFWCAASENPERASPSRTTSLEVTTDRGKHGNVAPERADGSTSSPTLHQVRVYRRVDGWLDFNGKYVSTWANIITQEVDAGIGRATVSGEAAVFPPVPDAGDV